MKRWPVVFTYVTKRGRQTMRVCCHTRAEARKLAASLRRTRRVQLVSAATR